MIEIQRDVTLRFFRSCAVNECHVERSGITRKYNKVTESSIIRIQRFVRKNQIQLDVDFMYFTEIHFICDKEMDEPEDSVYTQEFDAFSDADPGL